MPLPLTPFAPLMEAKGRAEPANPATLTYQLLERVVSSLPKGWPLARHGLLAARVDAPCASLGASGYANKTNAILLPLP